MKLLIIFLNLLCKEWLKVKIRGSESVFGSIDLLHNNLHKISLNRGISYIDSPKWQQ